MAVPPLSRLPLLSLLLLLLPPLSLSSPPPIGVTYRPLTASTAASPSRVVAALRSASISHAFLPSPSPAIVRAFLYSDISLVLSLPASLPSSPSAARRWISSTVLPFHPRARIIAIAVTPANLNSVNNLRSAALDLGLARIHITAVLPFASLTPPLPPSAARFTRPAAIEPLLSFLNSSGSPLFIDLFPFEIFSSDFRIPVGFALFEDSDSSFREDPASGLMYRNLFDEMLDSVITAVGAMGFGGMKVAVAGTGWPTTGAVEGTVEYARRYNEGLVKHLRLAEGTPMSREGAAAVYVRELFDDRSRVVEWERHLGIWYADNLSSKYELMIGGAARRFDFGVGAGVGVCLWLMMAVLI